MADLPSSTDPKKKTPKKITTPKDPRKAKGAGKYPNYYSHKTRSGHLFMMDDSNGAEHVTLQHRSGSAVNFNTDGSVVYTSHNGQFNIVFGENRIIVTGAYDIIVHGGGSLKVDGDYNVTVKGNANMDVNGDFNVSAKNMNQTIRGNIDVQAKNKTEKIEGSSTSQSQGAMSMISKGGMSIGSSGDALGLAGATMVGLASSGDVMISSGADTSIKSDTGVKIQAAAKLSLKGGSMIAGDAKPIKWNSGDAEDARDALQVFKQAGVSPPSSEPSTAISEGE
jgi:hypothetical protein